MDGRQSANGFGAEEVDDDRVAQRRLLDQEAVRGAGDDRQLGVRHAAYIEMACSKVAWSSPTITSVRLVTPFRSEARRQLQGPASERLTFPLTVRSELRKRRSVQR